MGGTEDEEHARIPDRVRHHPRCRRRDLKVQPIQGTAEAEGGEEAAQPHEQLVP